MHIHHNIADIKNYSCAPFVDGVRHLRSIGKPLNSTDSAVALIGARFFNGKTSFSESTKHFFIGVALLIPGINYIFAALFGKTYVAAKKEAADAEVSERNSRSELSDDVSGNADADDATKPSEEVTAERLQYPEGFLAQIRDYQVRMTADRAPEDDGSDTEPFSHGSESSDEPSGNVGADDTTKPSEEVTAERPQYPEGFLAQIRDYQARTMSGSVSGDDGSDTESLSHNSEFSDDPLGDVVIDTAETSPKTKTVTLTDEQIESAIEDLEKKLGDTVEEENDAEFSNQIQRFAEQASAAMQQNDEIAAILSAPLGSGAGKLTAEEQEEIDRELDAMEHEFYNGVDINLAFELRTEIFRLAGEIDRVRGEALTKKLKGADLMPYARTVTSDKKTLRSDIGIVLNLFRIKERGCQIIESLLTDERCNFTFIASLLIVLSGGAQKDEIRIACKTFVQMDSFKIEWPSVKKECDVFIARSQKTEAPTAIKVHGETLQKIINVLDARNKRSV